MTSKQKMEDDLKKNGRRPPPQKMEDDLNFCLSRNDDLKKWKTTSENMNGRRPPKKNGRQPKINY